MNARFQYFISCTYLIPPQHMLVKQSYCYIHHNLGNCHKWWKMVRKIDALLQRVCPQVINNDWSAKVITFQQNNHLQVCSYFRCWFEWTSKVSVCFLIWWFKTGSNKNKYNVKRQSILSFVLFKNLSGSAPTEIFYLTKKTTF